jgi:hypothetical protein
MLEPKGGFQDASLKAVFDAKRATATNAPPSGTPIAPIASASATASKKHVSAGAIAGGVVAGIAVVIIIAGLVFFLLRRKRQQAIRLPTNTNDLPPAYEKDSDVYHEMMATKGATELAGNNRPTHELPAVVPVYELPGMNSRANSRQNERAHSRQDERANSRQNQRANSRQNERAELESRGKTDDGSDTELNPTRS